MPPAVIPQEKTTPANLKSLVIKSRGFKHTWAEGSSELFCSFVRFPSSLSLIFHIFIFFSRTTGPFSAKLGTKHPWVKGIQFIQMKGPILFQGEIITK